MPENRGRVVVGMLSLALPVLLLWRCAARPEPPPAAPTATTRAPVAPPTPPLAAAPDPTPQGAAQPAREANDNSALAPASEATPSPVASLAAPSPSASSSAASGIIATVARRDPRDLALLSRIERELKRDPPPAVHALIRLRESGASRAQLLAEADKQLGSDVALRLLVRSWIDETAPGTAAPGAAAPPKTLGPTPGGAQDPLIKPIEPAKSPSRPRRQPHRAESRLSR